MQEEHRSTGVSFPHVQSQAATSKQLPPCPISIDGRGGARVSHPGHWRRRAETETQAGEGEEDSEVRACFLVFALPLVLLFFVLRSGGLRYCSCGLTLWCSQLCYLDDLGPLPFLSSSFPFTSVPLLRRRRRLLLLNRRNLQTPTSRRGRRSNVYTHLTIRTGD